MSARSVLAGLGIARFSILGILVTTRPLPIVLMTLALFRSRGFGVVELLIRVGGLNLGQTQKGSPLDEAAVEAYLEDPW